MVTSVVPDAGILKAESAKDREERPVNGVPGKPSISIPEIPAPSPVIAAQEKTPLFHWSVLLPVHPVNPPLQYCEAEAMLNEPVPMTWRSPDTRRSLFAEM